MTTEHELPHIRAAQAAAMRAQAETTRSTAAWLRAFGAPVWMCESAAAAADWWRARAEEAERE